MKKLLLLAAGTALGAVLTAAPAQADTPSTYGHGLADGTVTLGDLYVGPAVVVDDEFWHPAADELAPGIHWERWAACP